MAGRTSVVVAVSAEACAARMQLLACALHGLHACARRQQLLKPVPSSAPLTAWRRRHHCFLHIPLVIAAPPVHHPGRRPHCRCVAALMRAPHVCMPRACGVRDWRVHATAATHAAPAATLPPWRLAAVVYRGVLLEQGTHEQLMAIPNGGYARLVAAQLQKRGGGDGTGGPPPPAVPAAAP